MVFDGLLFLIVSTWYVAFHRKHRIMKTAPSRHSVSWWWFLGTLIVWLPWASRTDAYLPPSVLLVSTRIHHHSRPARRQSAILLGATTTTTSEDRGPRTWVQKPGWPPPASPRQKNANGQEQRPEQGTTTSIAMDATRRGNGSSSFNKNNNNSIVRQRRREKMKAMPVTGYDARAIEEYYDMRPWEVGWRLNSLGFPLLSWYGGLLWDKVWGIDTDPETQKRRGAQLREHLVRSQSVALIKSGQALSLRPDIIRNPYWAEELAKLVDAVGAFDDKEAMRIMRIELDDIAQRLAITQSEWQTPENKQMRKATRKDLTPLQKFVEKDDVLSLFEFYNDNKAVASASIGQVYKARIRPGKQLEAAIGREQAAIWGGCIVAIKIQRPDVEARASLDMYLLRRTAMWLSKIRGGDLPQIADAFGMQLFGELDYVREANNCERFQELYGYWDDIEIPTSCTALTRKKVLVQSWVEGEKGPWPGQYGIDMVRIGLRCSVDQLMTTGLFHADPHRGVRLNRTTDSSFVISYLMFIICHLHSAEFTQDSRWQISAHRFWNGGGNRGRFSVLTFRSRDWITK